MNATVFGLDDKVSKSGDTMSGNLTVPSLTVTGQLNANSDFETGLAPWTLGVGSSFTQSSTYAYQGTYSARLVPDGASSLAYFQSELIACAASASFTVQGWALCPTGYTPGGGNGFSISVNWYDNTTAYLSTSYYHIPLAAGIWTPYVTTYTSPGNAAYLSIDPNLGGTPPATAITYFDQVQVAQASSQNLASVIAQALQIPAAGADGKVLTADTFGNATWQPASGNGVTAWINAKNPAYGATGNGTTEDSTAIQAAINAAATFGTDVYLPAGTYKCTPGASPALTMTGVQGTRIFGDSALTTVLQKGGNGTLLSMSGAASDTTGNTHTKYCGLQDIGLNGGTFTGTMLLTYYADNLDFTRVRFKDNYDIVQDTAEYWDSRYYNCVWETSGSVSTPSAVMPNIRLRNSAAASGFGYSTDNVDQIHFIGCRWEDFRNGAVRIEQGVSSTNNPNGIFFTNCKMESSFLNGGVHLYTDSSARGVFVDQLYCFSGGFESGFSTAQDVIQLSSAATSLKKVWISNRAGVASVANGVTVNSTNATEAIAVEDVFGIYNTNPTGAHINIGTATGGFIIDNCPTNAGTQFAGTVPNGAAPGLMQTFAASGTWTKPPGATLVTVIAIGGGGGGGSGAVEASGTVASGGAGGGGGGLSVASFPAAILGSTETVTVGAGGAGGAAVGTTASAGNAGATGHNSSFRSSSLLVASGGTQGAAGTTGAATGGGAGGGGFSGSAGASSSATGAAGSTAAGTGMGGAGGGSGGGVTTGAAASAGGAGGAVNSSGGNAAGTAGASAGGAGGAGGGTTATYPVAGAGGGGGGSSVTAVAGGVGGAGGIYGAGGGGGGASLTGQLSGAGGAGAAGIVVVVTSVAT